MSKFDLRGIIVALVTPFNTHDKLDEERLKTHVDFLLGNGVHGLFPCGSAGEGPKLRTEERNKVIDLVVDQANGRVPVLAGISATSTTEAVESTKHAENAGADAAVILPPYYYRPSQDALKEHYETIARRTRLPIILYNIPQFAGYSLSVDLLSELAEDGMIAGLKDTSGDMIRFQELVLVLGSKIALLQGQEPLYVSSFILGTGGAVSADANLAPGLVVQVYKYFINGDWKKALEHQLKLAFLDKALSKNDFIETIKQAMTYIGKPFGHARGPASSLTESDQAALKKVLASLGLVSN
jgi:4-hydroxy-tetrahydrodipicolinate synthase